MFTEKFFSSNVAPLVQRTLWDSTIGPLKNRTVTSESVDLWKPKFSTAAFLCIHTTVLRHTVTFYTPATELRWDCPTLVKRKNGHKLSAQDTTKNNCAKELSWIMG
ncbi:hypothetical protein RRG08_006949 [Elysia crispata]|uniref:Uncharacterized protein n=1 Tax=Elysia crispata TaxID=231223 RepID=A0AAE0XR90_9GAST|nr:hypothetical protein RRG08_006949 [Elysia crispata]